MAWLSGHQDGFTMVGGLQAARSPVHLARVFELANEARLLPDPELAAHRLGLVLDGCRDHSMSGSDYLKRLSLNQQTTNSWSLREAIDGCVAAGLSSIGVWREPLAEVGVESARKWLADAGLRVSSLCRGGFFTAADPTLVEAAHAENLRAIDEAAAIGAGTLCLVPGGLPDGDRDLIGARARAAEAIGRLVPYAKSAGSHPRHRADEPDLRRRPGRRYRRSAQALDIAERFGADEVGVVLDTFHVWWDPALREQVPRAGARIFSYQVCDWITPLPADTLLARGMMGDGHIDFDTLHELRSRETGYAGDIEVEIFNADLWASPPGEVVDTMANRYVELVQPYLDE